jgi:plasmid stability protein
MPDLTIHGVPDEELEALGARAGRHSRSAEEEVLHLIHEAAAEEQLLQQLEETSRASEAVKKAEPRAAPVAAPARRRYRVVEPTPRKR